MCNQFSDVLVVDTIGRGMLLVEVLAGIVNCCQQGLGLLLLSIGVTFNP